jgi:NADH-quinone oxidoreductase subunit G
MVTVTIDGKRVEVPEGTNLVEAARRIGIEIPTYCYHPGLSVVGQCRICFVEVEKMPRLVTACSTLAQDGMVVFTQSERVKEARAAVMELLLANHPLDCPVCDQAGECLLQDYSFEHGLDTTHMVDKRRTYPGFERRLIGPHVVQNQNRCIHCTRCIRFTQEIAETHDLTMKSRGNHSFIDTFDGEPLDNPWSACVADVCPVGALTVKEFRFRARVWNLDVADSVCPGCSIGCAIRVNHLNGVVHRFTPRHNPEINGWWMCDYGRSLSESFNARDVERPTIRTEGAPSEVSWERALDLLADATKAKPLRVIASANLSNEAMYLAKLLFIDTLGCELIVPVSQGEQRTMKNGRGEWVASHNDHANSLGARLIGLELVDQTQLQRFLLASDARLVILDNRAHPWLLSDEAAQTVNQDGLVVMARVHSRLSESASLVLPTASWVEREGSYTSSTGRVQRGERAMYPAAEAKALWEILALLLGRIKPDRTMPVSPRAVFKELAEEVPAFAGMTYHRLAVEPGVPVLEEVPDVG